MLMTQIGGATGPMAEQIVLSMPTTEQPKVDYPLVAFLVLYVRHQTLMEQMII